MNGIGIAKYNEECRAIVMRYSAEWEKQITRVGRWIDFRNDYKTLDATYMESVWWVFKQLFDKGLVYRGFKVSSDGNDDDMKSEYVVGDDDSRDIGRRRIRRRRRIMLITSVVIIHHTRLTSGYGKCASFGGWALHGGGLFGAS